MAVPGTLTFYRGVTINLSFTYKADGIGVNLSGQTVVFHIRKTGKRINFLDVSSEGSGTLLGSTLTITNVVGGTFTIHVTDEDTSLMKFDEGTWWITLESGGNKKLIGRGAITVVVP